MIGSGKLRNVPQKERVVIDTLAHGDAGVTGTSVGELPRARRLAAFRALHHRNYRLFFMGQLISLIGTWMQTVAQAWLVLKLSNSPFALGVVAFANYTPILLMGLFAGVVVDNVDRRRLIVTAQTLLMLSAFALAGLTWAEVVRVEHVVILAALNGLVSSFDMPARQAFIVEMVGRDDLPNAIALNSMVFNSARTLGPAIAGMLIVLAGTAGCFFLNGLSYLAVIVALLEMDIAPRAVTRFGSLVLIRVREGLAYVWRHRPTFYLLLLCALNNGLGSQYTVLVPVFARDILGAGARGYGFLLGAQGVGALGGALWMASRMEGGRAQRRMLTLGIFLTAAGILVFGLSRWIVLSLISQFLVGAGFIIYLATTNTMVQLFVADELRGRVMSIYVLSFIGTAPLGSLAVGWIGERVSPEAAVTFCGIIALGCALFLLTKLKMLAAAQPAD